MRNRIFVAGLPACFALVWSGVAVASAPPATTASIGALAVGGGIMTGQLTLAKPETSTAVDQLGLIQNEAITGSGVNGPATSQQGLYIDVQKAGWYSGTAKPGQIEGLRINCRNGGGTTVGGSGANNPTRADGSCITSNAQAPDSSIGFINNRRTW